MEVAGIVKKFGRLVVWVMAPQAHADNLAGHSQEVTRDIDKLPRNNKGQQGSEAEL